MPAASEYFRVWLGAMDEDTKERVTEWAQRNLVASKVLCTTDGVELFGQRSESKNSKALKMMIRTLFQNWAIALQINRSDWLGLLTEEEFAQAMKPLPGKSDQSIAGEARSVQPRLRQPTVHNCREAGFRTHLSANFDEESTRLLHELRARGQISVECAA